MIFDSSQRTKFFSWLVCAAIKEISVTVSTMLVIIIGVVIFAAFAGSLYARPGGAPVPVVRPKRRAF
jgi:hypothetical protein